MSAPDSGTVEQYLPTADPMGGAHARLRGLARAYRGG